MGGQAIQRIDKHSSVLRLATVELRLTAEQALRASIDNQVFANLRQLEPLDGGRAVQAVYVALLRRLPNVFPDRKRLAIDTGFSESSVKRAIKLLELCQLVVVERSLGLTSTYHLADIRSVEIASKCVAFMRQMARSKSSRMAREGRVTSDPTFKKSRSTSEPGSEVTCDEAVGPQVTHKEARKIQQKQQGVAAGSSLQEVLNRWGLISASYLASPKHKHSIPALCENSDLAARLIDATMRRAAWSAGAGVGSKVAFLREHVPEEFSKLIAPGQLGENRSSRDTTRSIAESVEDEHERAAQRAVSAMTDEEFTRGCEGLFAKRPSLRKFYDGPDRKSVGLRALLAQTLTEASLSVPPSGSASLVSSLPMTDAFEPTE